MFFPLWLLILVLFLVYCAVCTSDAKHEAILEEIIELREAAQPSAVRSREWYDTEYGPPPAVREKHQTEPVAYRAGKFFRQFKHYDICKIPGCKGAHRSHVSQTGGN